VQKNFGDLKEDLKDAREDLKDDLRKP
jgi:hypothetical protein